MAFDLTDCQFQGPALPEPFVKFELEGELAKRKLLAKDKGAEAKEIRAHWEQYRRKLRSLGGSGGDIRVFHHVIEPLLSLLGYARQEIADKVRTREDLEDGGRLLISDDGQAKLRVWATAVNDDLYAPARRGHAYRFSYQRIAQRVLLASGERLGLLTNGVQLLLLISDPARPDSTITIPLDAGWKKLRDVPDSFRMFLALASPGGIAALPDLVDKARLQQARVTKDLRKQAREAVEHFIQQIIDEPRNREWFEQHPNRDALAKDLWHEGLITVYRLLFVLKLESSNDPARAFTFASTSLWRNTFSPSMALAQYARNVLEQGAETGELLEQGLRSLFRMFEHGLECTELNVKPLGGALFRPTATPTLAARVWGERSVAWLLDRLLWTPKKKGSATRERVHYGALDVEDLGRVYEALLELEPGISVEPMCRLRRQKLEVVVPVAQGDKYRPVVTSAVPADDSEEEPAEETGDEPEPEEADESDEAPARGKKTKVEWIELIHPGRFYLRVGLGRKASGSYYTPHSFVRFLVQETLGPQVAERSPPENPQPLEILKLKVLDPAMGSGHFLVEACRFLGEKLYEACRLCDEKALGLEKRGVPADVERVPLPVASATANANADDQDPSLAKTSISSIPTTPQGWRDRVLDLPDPDDALLSYLPSRAPEESEQGYSQHRGIAICRRLVATHCLYGVDKNPLAVELAKLALWLESHAEGMPLTFLDHRLVLGDSLTGPFWDKLIYRPGNPSEPVQNLYSQGLNLKIKNALSDAIRYVRDLEAGVGATVAENERKERTKRELDQSLRPFRIAVAAWSGGVMLGPTHCDDPAYTELLQTIANTGDLPDHIESPRLRTMIARGLAVDEVPEERTRLYELLQSGRCVPALSFDLTFPEVFFPTGVPFGRQGFHAVLGNPPWDTVRFLAHEFLAAFDLEVLDTPTKRERELFEERLLSMPEINALYQRMNRDVVEVLAAFDAMYTFQKVKVDGEWVTGDPDLAKVFAERVRQLTVNRGQIGLVLPAALHIAKSSVGIRRMFLDQSDLRVLYSFNNAKQLFEIEGKVKFDVIVAAADSTGTKSVKCMFGLRDAAALFDPQPLDFSREFIRSTGGLYDNFLELSSPLPHAIANRCYLDSHTFESWVSTRGAKFSRECDPTINVDLLLSVTESEFSDLQDVRDPDSLSRLFKAGYFVLGGEDSIHQFNDHWTESPRYMISLAALSKKPGWKHAAQHFRVLYRRIANVVDLRSMKATIVPPGWIASSPFANRTPHQTPTYQQLQILAVLNSFVFDWNLRLRITNTLNLFIVEALPVPKTSATTNKFLAHSALRLTCNHAGYAPLWREQLGDSWRESGHPPLTWPVLSGDDERWRVRAAIDAVVADAYGLSRDQYAHVLSTFSHSSYQRAPDLCLAAFDELQHIGLEAFTKKHDPYWDIPLNESLPQPVINLPFSAEVPVAPESPPDDDTEFRLTNQPATSTKPRTKKRTAKG